MREGCACLHVGHDALKDSLIHVLVAGGERRDLLRDGLDAVLALGLELRLEAAHVELSLVLRLHRDHLQTQTARSSVSQGKDIVQLGVRAAMDGQCGEGSNNKSKDRCTAHRSKELVAA